MKRILVLCTANTSRSQMAEGYLRYFAGRHAEVFSGGLQPGLINPFMQRVMLEDNIDLHHAAAKPVSTFRRQSFDYLITVCGDAAANVPPYLTAREVVHISIKDPNLVSGTENERLAAFRHCREHVKHEMLHFIGKYLIPEQAPLPTW